MDDKKPPLRRSHWYSVATGFFWFVTVLALGYWIWRNVFPALRDMH